MVVVLLVVVVVVVVVGVVRVGGVVVVVVVIVVVAVSATAPAPWCRGPATLAGSPRHSGALRIRIGLGLQCRAPPFPEVVVPDRLVKALPHDARMRRLTVRPVAGLLGLVELRVRLTCVTL